VTLVIQRAVDPASPETVMRLGNDVGPFGFRASEVSVDVVDVNLHHQTCGRRTWNLPPSLVRRGYVE
jgi:hypothetical protein